MMRLIRSLILTLITLTVIFTVSATVAQDGPLSSPADGVFEFPRDHLLHHDDPLMNGNYVEWLYFTGMVHDETGREWGYQVTLFTQVILERQAFVYDVALSDLLNSQFLHYRGTAAGDPSPASNLIYADAYFQLELAADGWHITFDGDAPDMATGETVPLSLSLNLSPEHYDYFLHGPDGAAEMGDCNGDPTTFDGYTYYYSHPALTTSGTMRVGDNEFVLEGDTWFDHQWGNFKHCTLAWNWFSLRLDDGRYIMLFQFLDARGMPLPDLLGASFLDVDGTLSFWLGPDVVSLTPTRFWTHPERGAVFALEWIIDTPIGTFAVEPYFDNQTPSYLAGMPYYWEGAMRVRETSHEGQQIGTGYLEVVPKAE
jgi:predicted secreted hydrolase